MGLSCFCDYDGAARLVRARPEKLQTIATFPVQSRPQGVGSARGKWQFVLGKW